MGVGFAPDYYVDISAYFAAKQQAIMAHHSQDPTRFSAAAQITNRFRAAQCNAPDGHYAEAYRLDTAAFPLPISGRCCCLPAIPAFCAWIRCPDLIGFYQPDTGMRQPVVAGKDVANPAQCRAAK